MELLGFWYLTLWYTILVHTLNESHPPLRLCSCEAYEVCWLKLKQLIELMRGFNSMGGLPSFSAAAVTSFKVLPFA